jgi:hypothetical protein
MTALTWLLMPLVKFDRIDVRPADEGAAVETAPAS